MSCCDLLLKETVKDLATLYEIKRFKDIVFGIGTTTLLFFFLKNHLTKLRAAEERASESDRLKNAFLKNISNDIIYPMNAIFNATKQLSAKHHYTLHNCESLDVIVKNTANLSNIVNEIIDLSLLQSGDIQPNITKVHLNRLIDEVQNKIKPQISKTIFFSNIKGKTEDDFQLYADGIKIKQILMRLLNNSIKFTQKGEIQFGYAIKHDTLIFFVKDTGIGIKSETQEKIFNVFHQDHDDNFSLKSGIGLGLTICQGYLHVLGGKIWVDSEEGIGSTFYFTLPFKPVLAGEEKKRASEFQMEMKEDTLN